MERQEYEFNFRRGLNNSRYVDSVEEIETPDVDNTSFASIGYYDGVEYGKYLVIAGMRYDVKEENLIAVIDKSFMRACEKVEENKNQKKL